MTCHFIDHFTIEIFQISPQPVSVSSYLTQIRRRSFTAEAPYAVQLVEVFDKFRDKSFYESCEFLCVAQLVKTQKYHFTEH